MCNSGWNHGSQTRIHDVVWSVGRSPLRSPPTNIEKKRARRHGELDGCRGLVDGELSHLTDYDENQHPKSMHVLSRPGGKKHKSIGQETP